MMIGWGRQGAGHGSDGRGGEASAGQSSAVDCMAWHGREGQGYDFVGFKITTVVRLKMPGPVEQRYVGCIFIDLDHFGS